jgi:hypothetical protein
MAGLHTSVQDEFAGLYCLYCPADRMHVTLLAKPRTACCPTAAATSLCITAAAELLRICWHPCASKQHQCGGQLSGTIASSMSGFCVCLFC